MRLHVHRLPCQPAGVDCSYRGWEGLTHTKCSLGVCLKALRTANLIFFCKAKGVTMRKPLPQGILALLLGLAQAVTSGWDSVLSQACDREAVSRLLAQVSCGWWLCDMPGLVHVSWGLSREARQRAKQTQERPLGKSRLFEVTCAKLSSGESSSHARRVTAFNSQQGMEGCDCLSNCRDSHP